MKFGIGLCLLSDKVQKIPLWHEREETAIGRQVGEVCNSDSVLADLARKLAYFLMRTFKELLQNTKLVHDFVGGGMNSVSAEITQKVVMLLEYDDVHARPRKQESQHDPGRAASGDARASLDYIIHADRLNYAVS